MTEFEIQKKQKIYQAGLFEKSDQAKQRRDLLVTSLQNDDQQCRSCMSTILQFFQ